MKFYRLAIQKFYFEKGYSLSHYFFKAAAVVGIAAGDAKSTLIMALAYGAFCYLLGRWAYNSGFSQAEIEVNNKIDPFVKEMRKKRKI